MGRELLLVGSLLPEYFGRRSEDRNLALLIEEYLASFESKYRLKLFLASAYPAILKQARELLQGYGVELEMMPVPFECRPDFNSRRPHEIAFCKQVMARHVRDSQYDLFLQLDADIRIPFADVDVLAAALDGDRSFVNIPYMVHFRHDAPGVQLGAYMHRKTLLDQLDYTKVIYRTTRSKGRVRRINAPDCAVRQYLLRHGAREVRAKPPRFRVTTRHYGHDGSYGLYQGGQMSRHWAGFDSLGFDPIKNTMAMEPQSCMFLMELCRRVGARSALDLGTGEGNSIRTLIAAGVNEIVSVDSDDRWLACAAERAIPNGSKLTFLNCPIRKMDGVSTYDLTALHGRPFDVVMIDGPRGGSGRGAAATQVKAAHYVFHDSIRDRTRVAAFIDALRRRGERCDVTWNDAGRGMASVSVCQAPTRSAAPASELCQESTCS